ncbi:type 1 glutamine amidotransferase [Actinomyces sp. zg-332]|uniref:type 1 glutamine amidotransferase n=1 Tax=Actinomyces sp. zg-332 TaxID=2708340 RepID=UPI0014237C76|nr:type 1 glutamine amidotransferase [Actinomyces sp. zg-332]QPK94521.1 type 1 glutamine amidotransferase [Actinomyces sp. zg-332]
MTKKILAIQHDEDVPIGNFQKWILDYDPSIEIEIIYAREKEIPVDCDTPVILFGGENNAYDHEKAPWLIKEKELICNLVKKNIPVFGICLGHQLGCVALGGEVEVSHPRGREVGVHKITLSALADDEPALAEYKQQLSEGEEIFVPEWHSDAVTAVPPKGKILASSDKYIQAVRCGSFLGTQFHPEVNINTMEKWTKDRADKKEILDEYNNKRKEIEKFGQTLLVGFLDSIK